ncbi:hypothetical protein [Roseibium sediminicola]|uniref:Uncharacterized protein n=1 Tax=Roseibium sediminicola TaxID=2933272 RepID=A0ABT0GW08_9HYPH|nr:hypothetical protein [Roseibium sp. CAU 1639]MCK7613624.1 hypothetical protein [Roseibium sp. CAU 1639]
MSLNLDRSFYSVISDLGKCLYTPEMELDEMSLPQIIRDLRAGQLENVRAILEFNPAEGWCNDVTGDVLAAAFPAEIGTVEPDWSDYHEERLDGHRAGVSVLVAA